MKRWLILGFLSLLFLAGCGKKAEPRDGQASGVEAVLQEGMAKTSSVPVEGPEEEEKPEEADAPAEEGNERVADNAEPDVVDAAAPEGIEETGDASEIGVAEGVDVDLTKLSSTMVYSEVYNMMSTPENYIGKVVKMRGVFASYHDEATGNDFFACIIQDAAACCSQGVEFVLRDEYSYPETGTEIAVMGTFDTYQEGEYLYCTLRDAVLL